VTPVADNKSVVTENSVIIQGLEGNKTSGSFSGGSVDINKKTEEIEQTKNTAAAVANLASLYERKQDDEKALVLVEKALKIDADNITAFETRGKIKSRKGDYTGAIGDFDKVIKIVPNLATVYLARGIAKMLAGSETEAQKDFDKFLQLLPNGKPYLDQEVEKARQTVQK
jgi:tetratricopeptide (TPR) repeat protein